MRHYLQGWSHLGHYAHHLRGCPLALRDSLPATCPKTTYAEWTQPTWPSPSETTIGLGSTKQRRHPPRHRKINGIPDTHEGSPSTTTLDARIWQRMRTPIPRNSGHCGHRRVFLHQTYQHSKRQKDHLRQNSLRLQTSQKRKGTCSADRGRRQTRLLRQRRHFHGRYHNIQNMNQQYPLHQGRRHDDDGH
jgi:hypothetical protein